MKVYKVWMDAEKETCPYHAGSISEIGLDCMEEAGETWVIELVEMSRDEFRSLEEWTGP